MVWEQKHVTSQMICFFKRGAFVNTQSWKNGHCLVPAFPCRRAVEAWFQGGGKGEGDPPRPRTPEQWGPQLQGDVATNSFHFFRDRVRKTNSFEKPCIWFYLIFLSENILIYLLCYISCYLENCFVYCTYFTFPTLSLAYCGGLGCRQFRSDGALGLRQYLFGCAHALTGAGKA